MPVEAPVMSTDFPWRSGIARFILLAPLRGEFWDGGNGLRTIRPYARGNPAPLAGSPLYQDFRPFQVACGLTDKGMFKSPNQQIARPGEPFYGDGPRVDVAKTASP